jgi:hypothetical protein
MQDWFKNKSVAIIGNSESLFSKNQGKEINSYDCVCRINRGIQIVNELSQGNKTDVWAYGSYKQVEDLFNEINCEKTLHLTHIDRTIRTDGFKKKQEYKFNKTKFYLPLSIIKDLAVNCNIHRPSSGLLLLYYVSLCDPGYVALYGFDWKETPTWYYNEFETVHRWADEKKFIEDNFLNKKNVELK